jgi:hypothetical protein
MLSRIRSTLQRLLYSDPPAWTLAEDEKVIVEGRMIFIAGLMGARIGRLTLTNHRLVWREPPAARPLKPYSGEIALADIASVDKGTLFDFFARGFRVRRRNGKDKVFPLVDGGRDEWIAAIRRLLADAGEDNK